MGAPCLPLLETWESTTLPQRSVIVSPVTGHDFSGSPSTGFVDGVKECRKDNKHGTGFSPNTHPTKPEVLFDQARTPDSL
jgi:hypothetical protein